MFEGNAEFANTTFKRFALFAGTTFEGGAGFGSATFKGNAIFMNARFRGGAHFLLAEFHGYGSFHDAHFEQEARFNAIRSESAFTLERARFAKVPNFIQAHFEEAPRLDNLRFRRKAVEPGGLWHSVFYLVDTHLTSKYRALKRVAIQGHDHEREQLFFAGELRSQRSLLGRDAGGRHNIRRLYRPKWYFNLLYGGLSDFGRSLPRPFFLWLASIAVMVYVHLAEHATRAADPALHGLGNIDCSPVLAALHLSIKKGMLVLGWDASEKISQNYACLYGETFHRASALGGALVPNIPDSIVFWQTGQTVVSAVLIFLFLLALRNHFRIK